MKVPMIALKALVYAGRRVAAGAEFVARGASDARVLIAIGKADFAPAAPGEESSAAPVAPPVDVARTADVEPVAATVVAPPIETPSVPSADDAVEAVEQPAAAPSAVETTAADSAEEPAPIVAKPKREYRRRDMRAEG
jgi:hypothetical protein